MAAAIDFMANWLCSCGKDDAGRSLPALLPASMNRFLLLIKRKFPTQSPEVQNLLRTFLHGLKENFTSSGADEIGNANASPEQFRFALRRVLGMVEGTAASLA
jgi:hypothetical protein